MLVSAEFEPVVALTPIEQKLGGSYGDGNEDEADMVEAARRALLLVAQRRQHAGQGHEAERQDEEEGPAPAQQVGDQAAEGRADDWPHYATHAPHHDDEGMLAAVERGQQDGLAHREDRRAERALHDPQRQQPLERIDQAA